MTTATRQQPIAPVAAAIESIQAIPSMLMECRHRTGCSLDSQLVVSLYIPAGSYCWSPQWAYLDTIGFDYRSQSASILVELYVSGRRLHQRSTGHPLSRRSTETISQWLDRVCNSPIASGIGVVIPAALLTQAQVDRLHSTLAKPKHSQASSDRLIKAFISGTPIDLAPPNTVPAALPAPIAEPVKQPTLEQPTLETAPSTATIADRILAMPSKELKAFFMESFGYKAPSIKLEDLRTLTIAKL